MDPQTIEVTLRDSEGNETIRHFNQSQWDEFLHDGDLYASYIDNKVHVMKPEAFDEIQQLNEDGLVPIILSRADVDIEQLSYVNENVKYLSEDIQEYRKRLLKALRESKILKIELDECKSKKIPEDVRRMAWPESWNLRFENAFGRSVDAGAGTGTGAGAGAGAGTGTGEKVCSFCTLINKAGVKECELCNTPFPTSTGGRSKRRPSSRNKRGRSRSRSRNKRGRSRH